MATSTWDVFCGGTGVAKTPTQFHWYSSGTVDLCWNQVVFSLPSHALVILVATLIVVFPRRRGSSVPWHLNLRRAICVLLALVHLGGFVGSWAALRAHPPVVWLSYIVKVFAYLGLLLAQVRSGVGHAPKSLWRRALVHCSWFLAFCSSAYSVYEVARLWAPPGGLYRSSYGQVYSVTAYATCALHLGYFATLLVSFFQPPLQHQQRQRKRKMRRQLQAVGSEESQSLLSGYEPSSYGTTAGGEEERDWESVSAEEAASYASQLAFCWLGHLLEMGWKGDLKSSADLDVLPRHLQTESVRVQFDRHVGVAIEKVFTLRSSSPGSGQVSEKFSLLRALNKTFGWEYYPLGLLRFFADLLGFVGPVLLHALVTFIENKAEPMAHGYLYASGLFLSTLVVALLQSQFSFRVNKIMVVMRAALVTSVYRKVLAVDTVSLGVFSTGEVVNMMSTDTDRVVNFANSFHYFWSLPFQVAIALYLLHQQVGLAFLAGLGFSLAMIPVNRFLANKIGSLSQKMMEKKDGRVKVMAEILRGIRVIKFYAWEKVFGGKIGKLREEELANLKGRKYLDALCVYLWAATPVVISLLTFGTYVAMGNKLTAAKVFTSVALFNMLITPLNAFPWVLNGLVESWVSMKRLQAFFTLPQISWRSYYLPASGGESLDQVLRMDRSTFTWSPDKASRQAKRLYSPEADAQASSPDDTEAGVTTGLLSLCDLNLSIHQGQLIGVAGIVGSGKSSLLAAVTAEMRHTAGEIYCSRLLDGFGLVTQESWLQHATVKENILFGKPLDLDRYREILFACALQEDLAILPSGDETEVGENGVTLSGGQKARISLARAVYQDKDLYLLDDPLAAVDVHVAQHLFRHCIMGLLAKKTRVLCTHHTQFLARADHVLWMENGQILRQGLPADVLAPEMLSRRQTEGTATTEGGRGPEKDDNANKDAKSPTPDVLVEEEEREKGVVSSSVYLSYWKAVGSVLATVVLLSLLLMQASRNVSDWWLSYWISHTRPQHGSTADNTTTTATTATAVSSFLSACSYSALQQFALVPMPDCFAADRLTSNGTAATTSSDISFYLTVYGSLGGANTVFTLCRAFLFAYGGVRAARVLHNRLLASILSAPVSFFDTTPIGRVLNRFSSDCYAIDDSLPFQLNILLAQLFGLLGTLCITCYGLPWFAVLLLPLGIVYYRIQRYYRRTSRELKRLSTVTLSPIYSHFSETLVGLPTIRAMRAVFRFAAENKRRLDISQRANYAGFATAVWLSLRLQLLGVIMVASVAMIAVLEHHFATVDAGLVGLAVSYALSVTGQLSGVVQVFTETEKEMISVERAVQYIDGVTAEKQTVCSPPVEVSADWPSAGAISVQDVHLTYRSGLPPALRGVSFMCRPGEKIGVVGRTGSGKSSLLQVLFRMVNYNQGNVTIDGVDIAAVPLSRLRSSMAIIPQDPFLFSGSIRHNLDPRDTCDDGQLNAALHQCHLSEAVSRLGGLDGEVGEAGCHFSVGQRQLICLARALLTGCKILCIDEATASVDQATDAQIQVTLRDAFPSTTVLTVAHRLETILPSDRVLVMDTGVVAEFAPPGDLLADSASMFSRLVQEAGV